MPVNKKDLKDWLACLEQMQDDIPLIIDKLAVEEGKYAVKQANKICKNEPGLINTGDYRHNWKSDNQAKKAGKKYIVKFYNTLEYAEPLEYGFRSHFVPGHWEGNTFVYAPKDPKGGMYVGPPGGYVRGHFTLLRAVHRTEEAQKGKAYKESR